MLLGNAGSDPETARRALDEGRLPGGDVPNATYRNHGTHAESIEIVFDPGRTSYRDVLEFFFQIHDPTTVNRQGNDIGMSYRSAIFYLDDEQRRVAEDTIADVEASGLWPGKVVTEVAPAGPFWEAEPEHQDYLERYPERVHLPFPAPELGAAAPDRIGRALAITAVAVSRVSPAAPRPAGPASGRSDRPPHRNSTAVRAWPAPPSSRPTRGRGE